MTNLATTLQGCSPSDLTVGVCARARAEAVTGNAFTELCHYRLPLHFSSVIFVRWKIVLHLLSDYGKMAYVINLSILI